jgi:23S rRNA (cytosine1962-C5)-methyltransferase
MPESGNHRKLHSASGEFLAIAAYSPQSQIVARVWGWERCEIDAQFFPRALGRQWRVAHLPQNDTVRLVHAESDGLAVKPPIATVFVVLQLSSAGAIRWRDAIAYASAVVKLNPSRTLGRRRACVGRDSAERRLLRGTPLLQAVIEEAGAKFEIDVPHGQNGFTSTSDNRSFCKGSPSNAKCSTAFIPADSPSMRCSVARPE